MPPLLTIGMPVYNGMPWLPDAIESLRAQTFQNFAALVVDDGSNDGSTEYLRSVRDPRFRIVRQENRGITATLNRILDEVESPWMVRHDSDDVAFPQRCARIANAISLFPDTGMFHSHAVHYQNGHRFGRLKATAGDPSFVRHLTEQGYLPSICHSAIAVNVDKVRSLGGYRFDLNVEEYDLYWRMALTYDIRLIPETLVGYRINGGSISARSMQAQAVNVLYIQYLLLSQIWGLPPQPYVTVRPFLETLVDFSLLDFRRHTRDALTALGKHQYGTSLWSFLQALKSSPQRFTGSIRYHLWPNRNVCVGRPPAQFSAHLRELWPSGAGNERAHSSARALTRQVSTLS